MRLKLGLIGYPIQHSLSPWIHNRFLEKAGTDGQYSLFEISPEDSFEKKLEHLKTSEINGLNVTVPYKQQIIPYLDELDWKAEMTGAVNTVVSNNGKWIGYNTDGTGYVRGLKEKYPSVFRDTSNRILILGAGGAARGIYQALAAEGFSRIDIANRTPSSAEAIAQSGNGGVQTAVLGLHEAGESLGHYSLIVQTTAVGMKPNAEEQIISLEHLDADSIVSDIIYQPLTTSLLQEARRRGASIHYGHTMLLYQAQYAFQLWTSEKVPICDMEQQLKNVLEGR
ncbi:shikimate dehydrogenase [Lentibacillus juripiscarius]|uniref:Shikimate dehydrogenase (NADP(+)) n=1 Tax=Lentibacillus juripiscarius TaxID=257446 RepID=A0ABW5V231_9BACI